MLSTPSNSCSLSFILSLIFSHYHALSFTFSYFFFLLFTPSLSLLHCFSPSPIPSFSYLSLSLSHFFQLILTQSFLLLSWPLFSFSVFLIFSLSLFLFLYDIILPFSHSLSHSYFFFLISSLLFFLTFFFFLLLFSCSFISVSVPQSVSLFSQSLSSILSFSVLLTHPTFSLPVLFVSVSLSYSLFHPVSFCRALASQVIHEAISYLKDEL